MVGMWAYLSCSLCWWWGLLCLLGSWGLSSSEYSILYGGYSIVDNVYLVLLIGMLVGYILGTLVVVIIIWSNLTEFYVTLGAILSDRIRREAEMEIEAGEYDADR